MKLQIHPHRNSYRQQLKQIIFGIFLSLVLMLVVTSNSFANRSYGPVKAKDYLSKIVNKSYPDSSLNKHQIMVAILRANPDAFRGGNIHFLEQGVILNLPNETDIATISTTEASAVIAEHLTFFKRRQTGNFVNKPLISSTPAPTPTDTNSDNTENVDQQATLPPKVKIEIRKEAQQKDNKEKQLQSLENISEQQNRTLQSLDKQIQALEEQVKRDQEQKKKKEEIQTEAPSSSTPDNNTPANNANTSEPPTSEPKQDEEPSAESVEKPTSDEDLANTHAENAISSIESKLSESAAAKEPSASQEPLAGKEPSADKEPSAGKENTSASNDTSATKIASLDKTNVDKMVSTEAETTTAATEPPAKNSLFSGIDKQLIPLFAALALGLLALGYFLINRSGSGQTVTTTTAPLEKTSSTQTSNVGISDQKELLNPVLKKQTKLVASNKTEDTIPASAAETEEDAEIKINMARAYMDMGYVDASKDILQEVINEGSQEQKDTAQQMLSML